MSLRRIGQSLLKIIAREKDSRDLAGKLKDFLFDTTLTLEFSSLTTKFKLS
jgi:hypothetical protein